MLIIFDIENKTCKDAFGSRYCGLLGALLITRNDKYIVYVINDAVELWNIEESFEVTAFEGHINSDSCLAITNDDQYLISSENYSAVMVWNLETRRQESVFNCAYEVHQILITSDNQYIIASACSQIGKFIIIWNLWERAQEAVLACHTEEIIKLAITSDNKYILSSCKNSIRVWDIRDKIEVYVFLWQFSNISAFVLTSTYEYDIFYSELHSLSVWNIKDRKRERCLPGHTVAVTCIIITSDSKNVISGAKDCTVRIWNVNNKREELILHGHGKGICTLRITSNSKYIVSSSLDFTTRVWNLSKIRRDILEDSGVNN